MNMVMTASGYGGVRPRSSLRQSASIGPHYLDIPILFSSTENVSTCKMKIIGKFALFNPVDVLVTVMDDGIALDCDRLGINAFGENRSCAMDDLTAELEFAWDKYAVGDRSGLSDSAIEYGDRLKNLVKKVE